MVRSVAHQNEVGINYFFSYGLIGVDCFSKIAMCSSTLSQSDEHTMTALEEWFEKYGVPKVIRCDNGGPFITECK